jgi:hypothetical protein
MNHDRIHAQPPSHHTDEWSVGTIETTTERDGHWVVTVAEADGAGRTVELTVTFAIRDLFVSRLDAASPAGQQVWYRERGE